MQCFEIFQLNNLFFFKSITLFFGGKERISAFPIRQARVGEISTKHKAQIAVSSTMTVSNHHRLCNRTIFSNTYIISHQSFSYRFPFIFDNSSFSTVIFIVAVYTEFTSRLSELDQTF